MKKNYVVALSILVLLSGCAKKNKKNDKMLKDSDKKGQQVEKNVNIPLASNEVKSYFDDKDDMNLGEFVLVEDSEIAKNSSDTGISKESDLTKNSEVALNSAEDFSWTQDADRDDKGFKKCHFDFDKYVVKSDEDKLVDANIASAKKLLAEGKNASVIIEGHSCHAAGSRTYNLVLSEKRAKNISDRFVAAGVPSDCIKIVARGQECPEKDGLGKEISGSIEQQGPNRRSEVRVINA